MNNKEKQIFSKWTLVLCYAVMCYTAFFFYPKWQQSEGEATISWDVSGYYMYLPALFIYNDIKQVAFGDSLMEKHKSTIGFEQAFLHKESGNKIMKYPSGQALVMLPFFTIAHTWASSNDRYEADGFTYPYQVCIGAGMLLIAFLGLFVFRKILRIYFNDTTVAIALLALVLGTNYLNYAAIDQAMTHNVLFTFYTIIIYFTIKFYNTSKLKYAIIVGFLCGWATLIRPTEVLSLLIPLFWGTASFKNIKDRISFVVQHKSKYLIAGIFFAAIVSVQLIYWKYVSGSWVVYSYQDQGFSFLSPHYNAYTWSYHSGWLRYTPMMILPFLGLIFFIRNKKNIIAVTAFFLINYYIVMSWDDWDYGYTGGRAMVQSYPVLFFPFCALIEWAWQKKALRLLLAGVLIMFSYLNIWWTYFSHRTGVQSAHISKAYYWKKAGRWTANEFDKKLIDNSDSYYGFPAKADTIFIQSFSPPLIVNEEHPNVFINTISNKTNTKKWIRLFAHLTTPDKEWEVWKQPKFIVKYYSNKREIKTNMIRVSRFIESNESKEVFMDSRPPRKHWDSLTIEFGAVSNNKDIFIDTIKVITFDK